MCREGKVEPNVCRESGTKIHVWGRESGTKCV